VRSCSCVAFIHFNWAYHRCAPHKHVQSGIGNGTFVGRLNATVDHWSAQTEDVFVLEFAGANASRPAGFPACEPLYCTLFSKPYSRTPARMHPLGPSRCVDQRVYVFW
jgi:hypothetical protein